MTTHPNEERGSTQCDRLLHHLRDVGPINAYDGWHVLGIGRIGARVYDLKARRYDVRTRMVTVHNRWGEKCHVAEYYLHREPVAMPEQQIGLLEVH